MFDIIVIGGGAHGVLAALQCLTFHPDKRIALFERRKQFLAHLEPGADLQYNNQIWTRNQLLKMLRESRIELFRSSGVESVRINEKQDQKQAVFEITTHRTAYQAQRVIAACGQDAKSLQVFASLGLNTSSFIPAAFQMRCDDARLKRLKLKNLDVALSWVKSGPPRKRIQIQLASAVPEVQTLKKVEGNISIQSDILAGTAVEEISFHIAKQPGPLPKRFKICINWLPEYGFQGILEYMHLVASTEAGKTIFRTRIFDLPLSLWSRLATASDIAKEARWQDLLPVQFQELATQLADSQFVMKPDLRRGSITNYRGGVHAENLHPDRPESKSIPGLFFAGSILEHELNDVTRNGPDFQDYDLSWIQYVGVNT